MVKKENSFKKLYRTLFLKYGKPKGQWALWCKRPKSVGEKERVIIEAILTQRANWKNVECAFSNLEKEKITSLASIYNLGRRNLQKLAYLIKPSGFYQNKAHCLFELSIFFIKNGGVVKVSKLPLKDLRGSLLALRGIGQETADSILLYALEKPIFVIDEYTRRLVKEKNLSQKFSYNYLQKLFEDNLPPDYSRQKSDIFPPKRDYKLYQDFHALIVIDGKNRGQKNF